VSAPHTPVSETTETIPQATYELLVNVARDVLQLIECNCSWEDDHCDGACTHGMAAQALRNLNESES
jgi:hypothetical protein